jgi:hypothetical protein
LVSIRRAHLRPGLGFGRCAGTCICNQESVDSTLATATAQEQQHGWHRV